MRQYAFGGIEGCVIQRRSRKTGTMVGLYHSLQSGMECDPATPWTTLCEDHSTLVCHATLDAARATLPDPTMWCEACREAPLPTRPPKKVDGSKNVTRILQSLTKAMFRGNLPTADREIAEMLALRRSGDTPERLAELEAKYGA